MREIDDALSNRKLPKNCRYVTFIYHGLDKKDKDKHKRKYLLMRLVEVGLEESNLRLWKPLLNINRVTMKVIDKMRKGENSSEIAVGTLVNIARKFEKASEGTLQEDLLGEVRKTINPAKGKIRRNEKHIKAELWDTENKKKYLLRQIDRDLKSIVDSLNKLRFGSKGLAEGVSERQEISVTIGDLEKVEKLVLALKSSERLNTETKKKR